MAVLVHKELSYAIVGASMAVHTALGPGYLESVYQKALVIELKRRGINFSEQHPLPVTYLGQSVGDFYADFLVEGKVVIEIKAASSIHPRHIAQAMNYLAASGLKLAIVINFGRDALKYERVVL